MRDRRDTRDKRDVMSNEHFHTFTIITQIKKIIVQTNHSSDYPQYSTKRACKDCKSVAIFVRE
jgi:hypothetical protein